VVVKVVGLGFRVAGFPMAGGLTVVVV